MAVKVYSPRIEIPQQIYWLKGININYDLMPEQAVKLLWGSDSGISRWPKDKMNLWNGGKSGIAKNVSLPFIHIRNGFDTTHGRLEQKNSKIGFAWPVEIASLVLEENEGSRIGDELTLMGIWAIVALRHNDEELIQEDKDLRPFYLNFIPRDFNFSLGYAYSAINWDDGFALMGAPKKLK